MTSATARRSPKAVRARPVSTVSRVRGGRGGFIVGIVLGAVIVVVVIGRQPGAVQRRTAELTGQQADRDKAQIGELTHQAMTTRDDLLLVVQGLAGALPVTTGGRVQLASAKQVASWVATSDKGVEAFAHPPSGSTATNVARVSLRAATQELRSAVRIYQEAIAAQGGERSRLLALAAADRDNAVLSWSVAGTQLDLLNINAGNGHAHVFLPADPSTGAFTADDDHEGGH